MQETSEHAAREARSTFEPAIRLLPRDLREDARRLYWLLRTIDDLVDERDPHAPGRVEAIEDWAHGRDADTPETAILTELSRRFPLPPEAMVEFCEGMRHDLAATSIRSEQDLERYCQQVGGSIGVILTRLFGSTHPECELRMATLGRAFQRTNILRDIDEDGAHGRVYISRQAIERFGFPAPGVRAALVRDQIERAEELYEQGLGAIPLLSRGKRGMALSAALYREILRQIERDGYGAGTGRSSVPGWRRRVLIARYRLSPAYR